MDHEDEDDIFGADSGISSIAGTLFAQQQGALNPNPTEGYGDNQLLKFTRRTSFCSFRRR